MQQTSTSFILIMSAQAQYLDTMFGLRGRTALVTGGTRGIGQRMTLALAQAGADIVLVQRAANPPNTQTRDQILALGGKVIIVECDLSDKVQVKGLAKKVTGPKSEGGLEQIIDIVINCGGIQRRCPAKDFSDEDWDEVSLSPP